MYTHTGFAEQLYFFIFFRPSRPFPSFFLLVAMVGLCKNKISLFRILTSEEGVTLGWPSLSSVGLESFFLFFFVKEKIRVSLK